MMSSTFESLEPRRMLATFTVSTLADSGAGSLRQAIIDANAAAGADVIEFDASLAGTIALGGTELPITESLTIQGPGPDRLTIDAGAASRIFNVFFGVSGIRGLTLTGGNVADSGGAVLVDSLARLTLSNVVISGNNAALDGGGVAAFGNLTISESILSGNSAGGSGGGIFTDGVVQVTRSTISGNNAALDGGGIANLAGEFRVSNTTISGNGATGDGGGIFSTGVLTVQNATIAANTAPATGGIRNEGGTFVLRSSIVAGHAAGDLFGTIVTGSTNNLVQDAASAAGLTNGVDGNLVGVDPLLGPLANNGGRTLTHSLLEGSPAIGAGTDAIGLTTDQRGGIFARGAQPDIGAYQRQQLSLVVDLTTDVDDGAYDAGNLSLREAITLANANPLPDSITFATGLNGQTVTLGGFDLPVGDDLSITGPGADLLTISGNGASRVFRLFAGQISISGLTITGGSVVDEGGGVLVDTLATVQLTDVVIRGNGAGFAGGGIANYGDLRLTGSTVAENTTAQDGGGIFSIGILNVISSTISGNEAVNGGGIATAGQTTIANSTIAANAAQSGGGILVDAGNATLRSSIVAGNAGGDVTGTLDADSDNNLIQDASTSGGLSHFVNGNLIGADPLLGPLADNGGPTPTHALLAGSPARGMGINPLNLETDQRGNARLEGSRVDIGAFEASVPPTPTGAADASNTHRVAWVDENGHVLVYQQGWTYEDLHAKTGAPLAIDDAVIWVDPKDGLTYVAAPSADGLILFIRNQAGLWSFSNLSLDTGATASPVRDLTQFTSVRQKIVLIAGLTAEGRIVAFQQTLQNVAGIPQFAFVDISQDLEDQGFTNPNLVGLTSYVPRWDTWHLAGVDTEGRIQSIWINRNNPAFTKWRLDNLSAITGAPALAGQLTVTLTSWGGINLTGLDNSGSLLTTWWVPRFGGLWAVTNLTDRFDGPPLVGGNLSAYTTPWGGINYVGLDETGATRVYWWVPRFGGTWVVSPLLPSSTPTSDIPTGALTSSSSAAGTLNVYGLSTDGHVLRMSWQPNAANTWVIEDLTEIADEV